MLYGGQSQRFTRIIFINTSTRILDSFESTFNILTLGFCYVLIFHLMHLRYFRWKCVKCYFFVVMSI